MAENGDALHDANPSQWLSVDLIYDLALREIDLQSRDWEEADARLRWLLGFIGVIFAGVLGVTGNLGARDPAVRLIAGSAVFFLLLAAALAFLAYLPRQFHRPPLIRELRTRYLTRSTAQTKLAIVDQLISVYDFNRGIISHKLAVYRRAHHLFLVSLVLLVVAIVVRLVTRQ
jgi:hypothetical protein